MNYMQRNVFAKTVGLFTTKKPDKPPTSTKHEFQENYTDVMSNFLSLSSSDREIHVDEVEPQPDASCYKDSMSFAKRKSSNQKYESARHHTTVTSDEDSAFIMALSEGRGYARCEVGLAAINVNSPHLILCQLSDNFWYSGTLTKLNILNAIEILVPNTYMTANGKSKLIKYIQTMYPNVKITPVPRRHYNESLGIDLIRQLCAPSHQNITMQVNEKFYTLASAAALLNYLEFIKLIKFVPSTLKIEYQPKYGTMLIDVETSQRLELLYSLSNEKAPKSSLFGVLNYCVTAIGKRNLRAKILQPLCDISLIKSSHSCVRELIEKGETLCNLTGILKQFSRVDKLLNLAVLIPQENTVKAAEIMINQALLLKTNLENIPKLYDILVQTEAPSFQNIRKCLEDPRYNFLLEQINSILSNTAGGQGSSHYFQRLYAVKPNINELLDASRKFYSDKVDAISEIVKQLGEKSKLPLKMMHTISRGFHMQMTLTKNQLSPKFPASFEIMSRNGFYVFITTQEITTMNSEIKEIIDMIQIASNIVVSELLMDIRQEIDAIYHLTGFIAELDIIQSLSTASKIGNYCEPTISDSIKIKDGIHPLLEHNINKTDCIPNNIIATSEYNFYFITGPNMGGKSIYIKMIAILQVMFQIGCFIPAKSGEFRICDKLFSRIGLSDNIENGASSFIVEMREMEYIIKNITPNSLVIIDELCRSTNPEEGKILAWRICEKLIKMNGVSNDGKYYKDGNEDPNQETINNLTMHNLLNVTSPFVFVATHFLELTKMNEQFYSVINLHLSAEQKIIEEEIHLQYLHKVESGVTPISRYGLALAKNVRFPCDVLPRADEILTEIMSNSTTSNLDFDNITFNMTRDSVKISQIERGLYDLTYNVVSVLRGEDETRTIKLDQINTLLYRFASTQNKEFITCIQNRTFEEILNLTENITDNTTSKINQSLTVGTSAAGKDSTTPKTSDLSFHSLKRRIASVEAKQQKKVCSGNYSNEFKKSEVFAVPAQIATKPNSEENKKQITANSLVIVRTSDIKKSSFKENIQPTSSSVLAKILHLNKFKTLNAGANQNQGKFKYSANQKLNYKSNLPKNHNLNFMTNKTTQSMLNKFLEGSNNSKLIDKAHCNLAKQVVPKLGDMYDDVENGIPEICILSPRINTDLNSSHVISLSSSENCSALNSSSFYNVSELGNSQSIASNYSGKDKLTYQTELYLKNIFHNEIKKHSTYKTSKTKDNRILKEKETTSLPIENTPNNVYEYEGNPISSFFSKRSSSSPCSTITSSSLEHQSLPAKIYHTSQNLVSSSEIKGPSRSRFGQSRSSSFTSVSKTSLEATSINLNQTKLTETIDPSERTVSFDIDELCSPTNHTWPIEETLSKPSIFTTPQSVITSSSMVNQYSNLPSIRPSDVVVGSTLINTITSANSRCTTSKFPASQSYVQGPIASCSNNLSEFTKPFERRVAYSKLYELSQRSNKNSTAQELNSTSVMGMNDLEMTGVNTVRNICLSPSNICYTEDSISPPDCFIISSTGSKSKDEELEFDVSFNLKMPRETPKIEQFSVGSTNVIKNITQEIMRECAKDNILLDEHVVSYAVNLVSLDPSHGLKLSSHFDRFKLENFVRMFIKRFSNLKNPSIVTLEMQVKFMLNPIDIEKIITTKREHFRNKTMKFIQEILNAQILGKGDREKLMKKMAIDAIVYNGLGNPGNMKVFNETFLVLESIMSNTDVNSFCTLPISEKMNTLDDVRAIIAGIRIFNKNAGHSAEGVIDLPYFVEQSCESTKSVLAINLHEIVDRVNLLTSALDVTLVYDEKIGENVVKLPKGIDSAQMCTLKDMLIMTRQHELYIRYLMEYLTDVKAQSTMYINSFRNILCEIHKIVQFKTAVATELVFPKFSELGKIWIKLQNQIFVLSQINLVANNLSELATKILPYEDIAYKALGTNLIETDGQRSNKANPKEPLLFGDMIIEFDSKLKIQLLGFCVVSLSEGHGMLIPGNPVQLGIIHYKDRYYAAKNVNAIKAFLNNPEKIIFGLVDAARKRPELIVFLDIFEQMKCGQEEYPELSADKRAICSEAGCQTEMHPIPYHKNNNYIWNIWDLRRKAIQLANIRNSQTNSSQTTMSYERLAIQTQTVSSKSASCQTMRDDETNVKPNKIILARQTKSTETDVQEHLLASDSEVTKFIDCLEKKQ